MNKTANKILMVFNAFLIVYCALGCIYIIFMGSGSAQQIPAFINLLSLCAMAYYALSGYKKSSANAYKTVLVLNALACLFSIFPSFFLEVKNPTIAFSVRLGCLLCFIGYLVLAFVKDLGRKKSNIIIILIFLIYLSVYIITLALKPGAMFGNSGTRFDTMRILRIQCMLITAANVGICNYFKYQDKKQRESN